MADCHEHQWIYFNQNSILINNLPQEYATNLETNLKRAFEQVKRNTKCKIHKMKFNVDRQTGAAYFQLRDLVLLLDKAPKSGKLNKFTRKVNTKSKKNSMTATIK